MSAQPDQCRRVLSRFIRSTACAAMDEFEYPGLTAKHQYENLGAI